MNECCFRAPYINMEINTLGLMIEMTSVGLVNLPKLLLVKPTCSRGAWLDNWRTVIYICVVEILTPVETVRV